MAETLDSLGHEVLGIDTNKDLIQALSTRMPNVQLIAADATDTSVLRDLGLESFDGAAVVIGENLQANILVTLILKELGLPLVIARSASTHHTRVLEKVGADRVIQPEVEMGVQMARTLASPIVLDYVDLGEDEALVEVEVPKKWVGKTLSDLHLYRKSGLTVIALKPRGRGGTIPRGDTVLNEGDVLIIGGNREDLDRSELYQT